MGQGAKTALAAVVVAALVAAFWMMLLSPKQEKADELGEQVTTRQTELASEQQRAAAAIEAKRNFPALYRQLVVLGKAVPAEAGTPSLLIQLNGIGARSDTTFESIALGGEGGSGGGSTGGEASGAELPIGAGAGPAGLSAMAYSLKFEGGFFQIADFLRGLDSLVKTKDGYVDARGRLVTIDAFKLAPSDEDGDDSGVLAGTFSASTYVTPPGQGLTAGASVAGPSTETAVE